MRGLGHPLNTLTGLSHAQCIDYQYSVYFDFVKHIDISRSASELMLQIKVCML